jgi:exodeoxyribonuclease III
MEILSWNVNGIRAIIKKKFIDFLGKRNPEILCIQETKISKETEIPKEIIEIKEYYKEMSFSETKKGYSGVITLSKEKAEKTSKNMGEKKFDQEGRIIIQNFKRFKLYNIYFPNGNMNSERLKYKMEFYDFFLKKIKKEIEKKEKIIVAGDLNTAHEELDLARPKENENHSGFLKMERYWMTEFEKTGMTDTFRHFHPKTIKYSYWSMRTNARKRNVGWRLDYIYTSKNLLKNIKESFILDEIEGSDHCPVGIKISF